MKVVAVLLVVLVVAYAAPEKRFLWKNIGSFFSNLFNAAKDEFSKVTSGLHVDFHSVVAKLVGMINTKTTQNGCVNICKNAATHVLGTVAAHLAGSACSPACKAALGQLQNAAGR